MADVKASVALSSDGRLQGFIGGSAANLGPIRIKTIQMQALQTLKLKYTTILLLQA